MPDGLSVLQSALPGKHTQARKQGAIRFYVRVTSSEQFFAVKNRIGTGQKAKRLQLLAHLLAAC
jgi:hypothetical protein